MIVFTIKRFEKLSEILCFYPETNDSSEGPVALEGRTKWFYRFENGQVETFVEKTTQ